MGVPKKIQSRYTGWPYTAHNSYRWTGRDWQGHNAVEWMDIMVICVHEEIEMKVAQFEADMEEALKPKPVAIVCGLLIGAAEYARTKAVAARPYDEGVYQFFSFMADQADEMFEQVIDEQRKRNAPEEADRLANIGLAGGDDPPAPDGTLLHVVPDHGAGDRGTRTDVPEPSGPDVGERKPTRRKRGSE